MAKIKKMQAGGVAKPAKRVGPVDPNGAYTKVQERTIAGKKAPKVPLKKDKPLGATKMKMGGKVTKAQNGFAKKMLRDKFNVAGPNTRRDKSGQLVQAFDSQLLSGMKSGGKLKKK